MFKILVIDDDQFFRRSVVDYLSMEGFNVIGYPHLLDLSMVSEGGLPDAIICDVMLPGCTGIDILKQIRAHASTAQIPFIFVSARAEPSVQREAMNLGGDDYITKPVSAEDLLGALKTRLSRLSGRVSQAAGSQEKSSKVRTAEEERARTVFERLTARERDVLRALIHGMGNTEIAVKLNIADSTVKRHLLQVFIKLGVQSRCMAVSMVLRSPELVWLLSQEATPSTV